MKKSLRHDTPRRGYALVIVLGVLALITGMMVAFLLRATTERSAAGGYVASVSARQLADTAVSVVQAQINDASTQGLHVAWASQPGMVRTFDDTGTLKNAYKLYSAKEMVTKNVGTSLLDDAPTAGGADGWDTNPGLWTDLNSPIVTNDASKTTPTPVNNYPIVDPAALADITNTAGTVPGLGPTKAKGFEITSAPVVSAAVNAIPMPVRWLYVLKDGKMVAPSKKDAKTVLINGESKTNPVVGRVAFWADDESTKVNINTASEQTFWDTPRGFTNTEVYLYGLRQPAMGEYSRYPGHPGTVSLSAVFPYTGTAPLPLYPGASPTATVPTLKDYLGLTPRYNFGGSEGGTVVMNNDAFANTSAIPNKGERLFASVDELAFKKDRTPGIFNKAVIDSRRFFITAHSRSPETTLFNTPRIAVWPVYQLNSSKNADLNKTTVYDRLVAFCSETDAPLPDKVFPYFFQRTTAYDSNDITSVPRNEDLYKYCQWMMKNNIPGFGGNMFDKYKDDFHSIEPKRNDADQILTEMFDYIRQCNLYDDNLTAGNQFTNGYNTMSGAPGHGTVVPLYYGANDTMGVGRYYTLRQLNLLFIACAVGPLPTAANPTPPEDPSNDPARNSMLAEPFPSGPGVKLVAVLVPTVPPTYVQQTRVQVMVYPEFFSPMHGVRLMCSNYRFDIEPGFTAGRSLGKLKLNSSVLNLPDIGYSYSNYDPHALGGGSGRGGPLEILVPFCDSAGGGKSDPGKWCGNPLNDSTVTIPSQSGRSSWYDKTPPLQRPIYPFVSTPVTVTGTTMSLSPLSIKFKLGYFLGNSANPSGLAVPIQEYNIELPSALSVPVPTIETNPVLPARTNVAIATMLTFYSDGIKAAPNFVASLPGDGTGRLNIGNGYTPGDLIRSGDVIRSALPTHGDYRVTAATRVVNPVSSTDTVRPKQFDAHPWYKLSNQLALLSSNADKGRQLISGVLSSSAGGISDEDLSSVSLTAASGTPSLGYPADLTGDFDMSIGSMEVGALANKPDDGDMMRVAAGGMFQWTDGFTIPYYQGSASGLDGKTYFSPNRVISSAVAFGSLPSGVRANVPWRTLLFRPVSTTETTHKGNLAPKDHLLLDMFWMPVVDPYAVSDRFSTAGKINMNYQILPFTYINRSTGLRAVLKNELVTRIPSSAKGSAVTPNLFSTSGTAGTKPDSTLEWRAAIDIDQTLIQFTRRFDKKDIFRSASEICEMTIVPVGGSVPAEGQQPDWSAYKSTADNLREKIYSDLYPKLTTKSNTYTVHFRAQALKKSAVSADGEWTEGRDTVASDYRGATEIERFINPEAQIPSYAPDPSVPLPLDAYYKWRVVQNRQFAP